MGITLFDIIIKVYEHLTELVIWVNQYLLIQSQLQLNLISTSKTCIFVILKLQFQFFDAFDPRRVGFIGRKSMGKCPDAGIPPLALFNTKIKLIFTFI